MNPLSEERGHLQHVQGHLGQAERGLFQRIKPLKETKLLLVIYRHPLPLSSLLGCGCP